MGDLFLYQDAYDEAMNAYRKSYHYNTLMKYKKGMIVNLCCIGETFTGYGNADSALYYYQEAHKEVQKTNDKKLIDWVQLELASLYSQLGKYDMVKPLLKTYGRFPNGNFYIIAANMHHETGNLDSATYYYHKVLENENIYLSQRAHLQLAEIAMKKGDAQSVMNHIRKYKE